MMLFTPREYYNDYNDTLFTRPVRRTRSTSFSPWYYQEDVPPQAPVHRIRRGSSAMNSPFRQQRRYPQNQPFRMYQQHPQQRTTEHEYHRQRRMRMEEEEDRFLRNMLEEERIQEQEEKDDENMMEDTSYDKIVRGPDGRLYLVSGGSAGISRRRAPKNNTPFRKLTVKQQKRKEEETEQEEGEEFFDSIEEESFDNDKNFPFATKEKASFVAPKDGLYDKKRKQPASAKLPKKKITIVVEDVVSDSEDEDDKLKSVLRNRRPSPGQWMEPIDV